MKFRGKLLCGETYGFEVPSNQPFAVGFERPRPELLDHLVGFGAFGDDDATEVC